MEKIYWPIFKTPWRQSFYKNGKLEGERIYYRYNNQVHIQEFYRKGKLHGERLEYDREGTLVKQTFWKKGVEINKKEFYSEGLSILDDRLKELGIKEIILSFL